MFPTAVDPAVINTHNERAPPRGLERSRIVSHVVRGRTALFSVCVLLGCFRTIAYKVKEKTPIDTLLYFAALSVSVKTCHATMLGVSGEKSLVKS